MALSLKNETRGEGAVCLGIKQPRRSGRRMTERRRGAEGCPCQPERFDFGPLHPEEAFTQALMVVGLFSFISLRCSKVSGDAPAPPARSPQPTSLRSDGRNS